MWTGFYFGGSVGASVFGGTQDSYREEFNSAGVAASLFGGYNWGMGSGWVLGAEGDFSILDTDHATADGGHTSSIDYAGTLRVRAGMEVGSSLVYATAGAAVIFGNTQSSSSDYGGRFHVWRPALGFGAETHISDNVTFRAEAMAYIGYDSVSPSGPGGTISEPTEFGTIYTGRIGLSIAF